MRRLAALVLSITAVACEGTVSGPGFDGGVAADADLDDGGRAIDANTDAGYEVPTPLTLLGWSPAVTVTAAGLAPIDFIVDTGSPVTLFDTDYYGGSPGVDTVDLTAFRQTFPAVDVVRFDAFGPLPAGAIPRIGGLIGSDFLIGRALTVDYHDARGYLFDSLTGDPWVAGRLRPSVTVPFQLEGGGSFGIPGDGSVPLSATRVIVDIDVEGTALSAIVDTGATHTFLEEGVFRSLGDAGRPVLDGVDVGLIGGGSSGFLSRVRRLDVGGASVDGASVLVVPGTSLFSSVSSETGRTIGALLGNTFLRAFLTTFDYRDRELLLAEFSDQDHIDAREWIGPGFAVGDGPSGDFLITDVYAGTDAEAAGIVEGMVVTEIDGSSVRSFDVPGFRRHLSSFAVGARIDVGVREGGAVNPISVLVEDLLPSYP
jgi:hypothetical protein